MKRLLRMLPGVLAAVLTGPALAVCDSTVDATAPSERFVLDDANGTAEDTLTGLVWKRCPEGYLFVPPAAAAAASCIQDGNAPTTFSVWTDVLNQFTDPPNWRVPNQKELASLVERQCLQPAIDQTVFPNTPSNLFWSASPTEDAAGEPSVFVVDFGTGGSFYLWQDVSAQDMVGPSVRLVRGGPAP